MGWSVGWLVRNAFVKIDEKWILNDLDSAGRGKERDEEEGETRRKKGRGERRDEEEEGTRRKEGGEEDGTRRVKK